MPNIWSHILYGHQVLERIGASDLTRNQPERNHFHIGCQGPDFLFYHNFLPWKKDKRMTRLGGAMHQNHCGPVLIGMAHWVQGRPLQDAGLLYVLGFMLHHALDRNLHPYIFYKSGFGKWKHQRFEIILDTIIVKKFWGVETWNTPVWKELDTGGALADSVPEMLDYIARAYYPEISAGIGIADWNQANRDMVSAQKLFHDPSGLKRVLTLGQIEPLVYKRNNAPLDYTNEAKLPWNCPTDVQEIHTHNVWDLWETAIADGVRIARAAIDYWSAAQKTAKEDRPAEADALIQAEQRLADTTGNFSYETGKPCESGLEIRYVNPII